MKDNSFERAMSQIVGEAEAEHQTALRHERNALLLGRVRTGVKFGLVAAVFVTAFCYRVELQSFVTEKLQHKSKLAAVMGTDTDGKPQGGATGNISKAADNASKRDQIIDEIAR